MIQGMFRAVIEKFIPLAVSYARGMGLFPYLFMDTTKLLSKRNVIALL